MNPNEFVRLANKIMSKELMLTKLPVYKRMFYRAYVRRINDHLKESKDNTIVSAMDTIKSEFNET